MLVARAIKMIRIVFEAVLILAARNYKKAQLFSGNNRCGFYFHQVFRRNQSFYFNHGGAGFDGGKKFAMRPAVFFPA